MQVYDFSRKVNRSNRYVGLPPLSASVYSLIPNPAKDYLHLKTKGTPNNSTFQLFDLSGRIVLDVEVLSEKQRVSVSHLKRGFYIAVINDGGNRFSQKLVVE